MVDLRKLKSLVSELADPQLTDVFAENQARGDRVTTLSTRRLATGRLRDQTITLPAVSAEIVFVTRSRRDLCIRSASLLRLPGFWLHTLPFERRAHGVTPMRSLCCRVPDPHELSVLPLAVLRRVTQPLTSRVQLCCGGLEGSPTLTTVSHVRGLSRTQHSACFQLSGETPRSLP